MKHPSILMVPARLLALISWRVFRQQPNMGQKVTVIGTYDGATKNNPPSIDSSRAFEFLNLPGI